MNFRMITTNFSGVRKLRKFTVSLNLNKVFLKDAGGMANSVDPDQTALGLHCLLMPMHLKRYDFYVTYLISED